MDSNHPVITLCIEGICAEVEHRSEDARQCYLHAWDACTNEYEACIAAHYVARVQDTVEEALKWNLRALELAYIVPQEKVRDFYPALFMSTAHAYKQLGGTVQAQRYYRLAAGLGEVHPLETQDDLVTWVKLFFWFQPQLEPNWSTS